MQLCKALLCWPAFFLFCPSSVLFLLCLWEMIFLQRPRQRFSDPCSKCYSCGPSLTISTVTWYSNGLFVQFSYRAKISLCCLLKRKGCTRRFPNFIFVCDFVTSKSTNTGMYLSNRTLHLIIRIIYIFIFFQ